MAEHTANIGLIPPRSCTTELDQLESLLRIAWAQWPRKSDEDREHERRFIKRDSEKR